MRIPLGYAEPATSAEAQVQRSNAWEAPRLPATLRTIVPRFAGAPTWTPRGTIPLVRHRSADGSRCVITNSRSSPAGFSIEFDLGVVHREAQPGTARLLAEEGMFRLTDFEGPLDGDVGELGFVELAPLPLLDALELRVDPASGAPTLVAGPCDPLVTITEPGSALGFIESFPLNPRHAPARTVDRGLLVLSRRLSDPEWAHRYEVGARPGPDALALGGVWDREHLATTPLWFENGLVRSELLPERMPVTAGLDARVTARWALAPIAWAGARPRRWAVRASGARVRRALSRPPAPADGGRSAVPAPARREPAPGWSAVYSAIHPVTGDQFLTRSELEATDLGYRVEGVLGYLADRRADPALGHQMPDIRWASRFGQRRRYVEGPRT